MNIDKYIFRAHMVGKIISVPKPLTKNQRETLEAYEERVKGIGNPLTEKQISDWHSLRHKDNESKKYSLTDGQKTILRDIVRQEKFGYTEYMNADEAEKGLMVEKESRDLLSEVLSTPLVKDDERKSNEWVTGKRDIKASVIIDIKSAFSHSSFSKMLDDDFKENEIYLRQADSYMDLWDCKESIIAHVLVDTPLEIVEKKVRQVLYRSRLFNAISKELTNEGFEIIKGIVSDHIVTSEAFENFCNHGFQIYGNDYIEFSKHDFPKWNETPKWERIHMIQHQFESERIEQRNECIKLSRNYMKTVKTFNNLIKIEA